MNLIVVRDFVIWGSALYHLGMGTLSMIELRTLRKVVRGLYALETPETIDPRFEYGIRPLGIFALGLSAFCFRAVLVLDDGFSRFLTEVLIFTFLARAAARLLYRELFTRAFGTPFRRSLKNIVFNVLLSAILIATLV
jgi:hypothetical protein